MSHDRSGEIANIDDLDPGQEYYIISAHWGAAQHASKVGDRVDMTTGHGGAWNPGQSGGEKWSIQRASGGYNIRSVEYGSYLGFHHAEIDGAGFAGAQSASAGISGARNASAGLTGARNASAGFTASKGPSAGLTASKEPFAWTVEPQDKGDGGFRFTVPHTEVHVDFSSVASVDQSVGVETTEADFAASGGTTEADFAACEQTTEADFAASESDEAAFAREMAAAGHNFDSSAGRGNADSSVELNAEGGVEANGGGSVEEGAGPTLHAFGRPYGFPPGYFSK